MEVGMLMGHRVSRTAGLIQAVVGDARRATVFILYLLVHKLRLQRDAVDPQAM